MSVVFLAEKRLIQTDSLTHLRGLRLGIDGTHWLKKVMSKEPFAMAMGGVPWNLRGLVERELERFRTFGITPVFVFGGLNVLKKEKPFRAEDSRSGKRNAFWDAYEKGTFAGDNINKATSFGMDDG